MAISNTRWRPWLYLVALLGSQLLALVVLVTLLAFFPELRYWVETPWGAFSVTVFGGLAAFSVVALLSGSRYQLLKPFEFHSIRQAPNYLSIGTGFILGLAGVFLTRFGVADFADNYPVMSPFVRAVGPERYLFLILLLVGPIVEESIVRGFLYRAFRRSYGITVSISAILVVAIFNHPGTFAASLSLFLLLGVSQILLCLILEKTDNLWNCIACHCVYNAVVACAWLMQSSS